MRLSLWVTHAWAGGTSLERAVRQALPDADHVAGDLARLEVWQELGEQALLVALPAPGDLAGMPRASLDAQGAAATAGECAYVPGIGGLLVPSISTYGSGAGGALDLGLRVDWTAYDADPVPRHGIEALEPSQLERHLREGLRDLTATLDDLGGQPFAATAARELADAALGGRWAVPDGLPARAARVVSLAGTIGQVVDVALDAGDGALTASDTAARHSTLLRLQRLADRALADATNAACAVLAGWRPG